jgi:hypothetical protein
MAWHAGTTSGYRDALAKVVQMATSKHVSAAVKNAGGSGYTVGDVLSVPHAGGLLEATVEVLTLSGSAVDTVKLRNMGAYSNRVASATVVVGGANYAVGDILEVDGGTATEKARLRVATLSGSAVATVTVYEGGGAYSTAPSGTQTTTLVGPSTGTGTGATFTVTMSTLVGTTNVATTGGTGTGATLDLTLTDTGWTALRNRNNFSHNSVNDEKEVVLRGTSGGGDHPYVGFRTYTRTVGLDTYYYFYSCGMSAFNAGLALSAQQDVSATTVANNLPITPLFNTSMPFWFAINGRRIFTEFRTDGGAVDSYQSGYHGLGRPFGTQTENPFPMLVCGSLADFDQKPDSAAESNTGLSEARQAAGFTTPMYMFEITDRTWRNLANTLDSATEATTRGVYPGFAGAAVGSLEGAIVAPGPINMTTEVFRVAGGAATRSVKPTVDPGDDPFLLWPLTVLSTADGATQGVLTFVHCELEGLFWVSATKTDGSLIAPQDTFTVGSDRYRVFPCAHRRERYSFFCVKEA